MTAHEPFSVRQFAGVLRRRRFVLAQTVALVGVAALMLALQAPSRYEASAVLLTLWDAHDRSTADFMRTFYRCVQQGWSKARAAQEGMRVLREQRPHPFYWAPFTLIGNAHGTRGFPLKLA